MTTKITMKDGVDMLRWSTASSKSAPVESRAGAWRHSAWPQDDALRRAIAGIFLARPWFDGATLFFFAAHVFPGVAAVCGSR